MQKDGPSLHSKIQPEHLTQYEGNYWLVSQEQRENFLELYHSKKLEGIKKLTRKDNDSVSLPLSRSILITENNTPFVLYEGKEKLLGQGTFGKVKIGQNLLTGEFVAIKIIKNSKKSDPQSIEKEKGVLHKLNMLKGFQDEDLRQKKYIVLPLIHGENLKLFSLDHGSLHKHGIHMLLAIMLVENLLNELDYMHKSDVIHRDIKPENILFMHSGECKLVDFGLSNYLNGEISTYETRSGDGKYLPPPLFQLTVELSNASQNFIMKKNRANLQRFKEIIAIYKKYPFSISEDYHAMYLTLSELKLLQIIGDLKYSGNPVLKHLAEDLLKHLDNFSVSTSKASDKLEQVPMYKPPYIYPLVDNAQAALGEKEESKAEPKFYAEQREMVDTITHDLPKRVVFLQESLEQAQKELKELKHQLMSELRISPEEAKDAVESEIQAILAPPSPHQSLQKKK